MSSLEPCHQKLWTLDSQIRASVRDELDSEHQATRNASADRISTCASMRRTVFWFVQGATSINPPLSIQSYLTTRGNRCSQLCRYRQSHPGLSLRFLCQNWSSRRGRQQNPPVSSDRRHRIGYVASPQPGHPHPAGSVRCPG